ncbi:SAF domain-containing protein [Jatrophihabitans sp.]|uniref:SAF domain-containing protein n=1 Tax=Jatrophihabitans sp. TaxID=1932789 RepID=UPI002C7891ED|nr:SAF domain-containing protein [Jatrophihabitans sp.]
MTDTSLLRADLPSPVPRRLTRPRWLDPRLIGGVVLVLVSVLLGSLLVASADHRQPVWSLTRDVAAGTVLTGADLRPVRVQLGTAASRYLAADVAVAGRTVHHALRAGELLAAAEVTDPEPGVTVTIPMQPENAPEVSRGERITLWLSTKTCRGVVLLSGVPVQSAGKVSGSAFGSTAGSLLVVRVSAADARRVVSALDLDGAVLRAGVLSAAERAEPQSDSLAGCAGDAR